MYKIVAIISLGCIVGLHYLEVAEVRLMYNTCIANKTVDQRADNVVQQASKQRVAFRQEQIKRECRELAQGHVII